MMCWIFQDKTGSRSYFGVGMPTLPTSTIALAGIQTLVYYMQLYFSKFCWLVCRYKSENFELVRKYITQKTAHASVSKFKKIF